MNTPKQEEFERSILEMLGRSALRLGYLWKFLEACGVDHDRSKETVTRLVRLRLIEGKGPEPWTDNAIVHLAKKGKASLLSARAKRQFNIRPEARMIEDLGLLARAGESPTDVAIGILEEGIRTRKHPLIDFRWSPTGRKPFVRGTGFSVWEIFFIWNDFGKNVAEVCKNYPYITATQVQAAIEYAHSYFHELPAGDAGMKPPSAQEASL